MSNDIEKRLKGEQVHKTGPRGEALFCMTAVYQFILAVAAAAAFGDSWSGSSGCTGGRAAAASWIAPGCVVEAFPIAIAEAFPICLAPGARTDIMSAAAVAAAASAITAATAVAAAAATSTAASTVIAASASTVVATATATSTITTIPSTSTNSKATHILYSPFLLVCTISYGTLRQSVSDCLNVFYCHPLFFSS
ncbi:hypothetical protein ADH76_14775 [Enterocloster clostridioformis]|nr:hypothetical protein A4V08_35960 [Lachnoclostridium sp. YL32]NDO29959.1 hypothetical protein [Enterocloster clostridioformis]OXE67336.1 hypothetical protein ADH76_14775 [Enterocloster clostridioformis]